MASADFTPFNLEYRGRVALITIDNQKKLNALSGPQYYALSQLLREVAKKEEVFITVITGKGRFFSAGADVSIGRAGPDDPRDAHNHFLRGFVANNLNITHAFATHPKILVVGLNGPVVGLSAAVIAHADFIYSTPDAFLLTPFSSLGLVAEGGASRALVLRLGQGKANEALIMSRRIPADELKSAGFVNEIFEVGKGGNSDAFRDRVLKEVDDRLGPHLIGESLLGIKALIRKPELESVHKANVHEVFAGLDRFLSGVPQEQFRKIASGEKRHKL